MINKIKIKNYKQFEDFTLELNNELNVLVGDNETGKSTILEAINLVLTKRLNAKLIEYELNPFLFNSSVSKKYISEIQTKTNPKPPEIVIEIYLNPDDSNSKYKGTMNSLKEDVPGMKIEICFDEEYREDYEELIKDPTKLKHIPTEMYKVSWLSFASNPIHPKTRPIKISFIDATTINLQNGTDYYIQDIINNELEVKDRVGLNIAYRGLKEDFSNQESIKQINTNLTLKKTAITDKAISISIDISQKTSWENNLTPHLDELPFHQAGKGEQSALKIMLALERKANESSIILIEEPENHLSFSSLNILLNRIRSKYSGKQIIVTTHDAFVLNKIGLKSLVLLHAKTSAKLKDLSVETQDYFMKLSGYDTLRLILAKKTILVEGPSEELIIQKAYMKTNDGKLPINNGTDVVNVRGLSFLRFLEIAKLLKKHVVVVTDNDGDYENNITNKYKEYSDDKNIKICSPGNNSLTTLEPNLVEVNDISTINTVLDKSFKDNAEAIEYMTKSNNKTSVALKIFESVQDINFPDYINEAIN